MAQNKSWIQNQVESVVASALLFCLRTFPLPVARALASVCGHVLDVAVPKLRRVAARNLALAFPGLDLASRERIIAGTFQTVGRLLLAFARFPTINRSNVADWISYEGLEHYHNAKGLGRGVLIATAHLGNWELSAYAHALMTEPMNVMVRPLDNPLIDQLVEDGRTSSGNRLIYKKDAARAVLRALKKNEAVGILIDQNSSLSEGVFVNFFGTPACANSAFVKFAQHSQAPVIPGFAFWNEKDRRYTLRFYPPVPMTGNEVADTQAVQSVLEQIIRQYPDQWMWIHRRWKTRPPGAPPLY